MRSSYVSALVVLAAVLGCQTADRKKEIARADCDAATAGLRTWLAMMDREGRVEPEWIADPNDAARVLSRPSTPVNLVRWEAPPSPLPHVPILTLDRRVVRWLDDVASIDHADAVVEKARATSGPMSIGGLGAYEVNPIILRIAADEQWGDVVTLVESVTRHQFHQALFAFAAAGLAIAPRDSKYAAEMRRNAMDDERMPWQREAENERVLARANPACPKIGAYFSPHPSGSAESELAEGVFMASVAGQAAACSCEVDFDAIRAFTWFRKGRQWGPLTSNRELEIASRAAQTELLTAPASMRWREAHRVILAARIATPGESPPRFTLAVR